MLKVKAFDVVCAFVKERERESQGELQIDEEKLDILSSYCEVIDSIVDECFGKSITVDISEEHFVCIDLVLSDFVYEKRFKPTAYLELLKRSIDVRFRKVDESSVWMTMRFPSLFID